MTKNKLSTLFTLLLTLVALASSLSSVSAAASSCRLYDNFCLDRQNAQAEYLAKTNSHGGRVDIMVPATTCPANDPFCQTRLDLQKAGISKDSKTLNKNFWNRKFHSRYNYNH